MRRRRFKRRSGPPERAKRDPAGYKLSNAVVNVSRRCEVTRDVAREWLKPIFMGVVAGGESGEEWLYCPYCDEKLTVSSLSFDHKDPISRGGAKWQNDDGTFNVVPCCIVCNKAKGNLSAFEWTELLITMKDWPQEARDSVTRRLRLGGAMMHRFWSRRRRG